MENGLYIVSTPIGNLGDISSRAIITLKNSDLIICENPKHSLKLLSKLEIKKKLMSLHDYNEEIVIEKISEKLKHKKISLISDAGSPLVSDPGYKLVRYCIENKLFVTVIPGASALTSALQLSSIPINKYIFHGFLPKSKKNIIDFAKMLKSSETTSVFFVSRHKILLFLQILTEEIPLRKIAICKELTKVNEWVFVGLCKKVRDEFIEKPKNSLGEFVIVVEGVSVDNKKTSAELSLDTIGVVKKLLKKFSLTDTVEIVHKIGNIGKQKLYKKILDIKNEK